jgi:outer membrane phospholipase A
MRISRSQEQWQTIIEDQQSSGLTIIDYCQQLILTCIVTNHLNIEQKSSTTKNEQ